MFDKMSTDQTHDNDRRRMKKHRKRQKIDAGKQHHRAFVLTCCVSFDPHRHISLRVNGMKNVQPTQCRDDVV